MGVRWRGRLGFGPCFLQALLDGPGGEQAVHRPGVLCGGGLQPGQPAKAAEVLEPFELADKELAPAFRIVFLTTQTLSGKIPDNDPQITGFPWSALQASENRKFSALIRSVR